MRIDCCTPTVYWAQCSATTACDVGVLAVVIIDLDFNTVWCVNADLCEPAVAV